MKNKIILAVIFVFPLFMMGNAEKWAGPWVVSYDANFNSGWVFQELEFTDEGQVNINSDGVAKQAGRWIVEEIIPKGSPIPFRLLKFNIWENEFIILYNYPEKYHRGRAIISDNQSNWPMNPIRFDLKRRNNE